MKKIPPLTKMLLVNIGWVRAFAGRLHSIKRTRCRLKLLKKLPRNAICAEIGVWKGSFSSQILNHTSPKELHLVDPWAFESTLKNRMYGGKVARNQNDMDEIYETILKRFCAKARVFRMASSRYFDDRVSDSLDWVYIDGDHTKTVVLQDLIACFCVVKDNGFITRDDYHWREEDGSYPVREAVDEFCAQYHLQRELVGDQFLIRKKET